MDFLNRILGKKEETEKVEILGDVEVIIENNSTQEEELKKVQLLNSQRNLAGRLVRVSVTSLSILLPLGIGILAFRTDSFILLSSSFTSPLQIDLQEMVVQLSEQLSYQEAETIGISFAISALIVVVYLYMFLIISIMGMLSRSMSIITDSGEDALENTGRVIRNNEERLRDIRASFETKFIIIGIVSIILVLAYYIILPLGMSFEITATEIRENQQLIGVAVLLVGVYASPILLALNGVLDYFTD